LSSSVSNRERAIFGVAKKAARFIKDGDVLGLGSGSTVARFAKFLGERVREEELDVFVVPSSMQAWTLARQNELKLYQDSAHCPRTIDLAIDGADQISTKTRAMIKGGGGQLLKEKIILSSSKRNLILVDDSKLSNKLNRSVPIEVHQFALEPVKRMLKTNFESEPKLRVLDKGYPYFTESGNVIVDTDFGEIDDPKTLEVSTKRMPGVIEVGIFNCKVDKFLVGNQRGFVEEL
jgi:ribose 5-phosphate isomerase A